MRGDDASSWWRARARTSWIPANGIPSCRLRKFASSDSKTEVSSPAGACLTSHIFRRTPASSRTSLAFPGRNVPAGDSGGEISRQYRHPVLLQYTEDRHRLLVESECRSRQTIPRRSLFCFPTRKTARSIWARCFSRASGCRKSACSNSSPTIQTRFPSCLCTGCSRVRRPGHKRSTGCLPIRGSARITNSGCICTRQACRSGDPRRLLRDELDRFDARFSKIKPNANLKRAILIGHSMGGLICSMMIREGGEKLWSQFSDIPASELRLSPEAKRELLKILYFSPRTDVSSRHLCFDAPSRQPTRAAADRRVLCKPHPAPFQRAPREAGTLRNPAQHAR